MFPCTKCGCCCKRVGIIIEVSPGLFPYKANKNGECEMLENNKCKVYDHRPLICNIDELFKSVVISKEKYYQENIQACNEMMNEDNVPLEFRIT